MSIITLIMPSNQFHGSNHINILIHIISLTIQILFYVFTSSSMTNLILHLAALPLHSWWCNNGPIGGNGSLLKPRNSGRTAQTGSVSLCELGTDKRKVVETRAQTSKPKYRRGNLKKRSRHMCPSLQSFDSFTRKKFRHNWCWWKLFECCSKFEPNAHD